MKEENWRQEIVSLNEALQHLTKKKDKSNKAMVKFQTRSRESALITKTLGAFSLDNNKVAEKEPWEMRNDSKLAQEMAIEIEASLEGLGNIDINSR